MKWCGFFFITCLNLVFASLPKLENNEDPKRLPRLPRKHSLKSKRHRHFRPKTGNLGAAHMSVANMTCHFFEQPLNHFMLPLEESPTFNQRYCLYDEYVVDKNTAPIFFYTGNESPLEEYINNTGLIWELAPHFQAQVVFVEHRYEGKSLPSPSNPKCMSYSSSIQAIEDYGRWLEYFMLGGNISNPTLNVRPVIAFGGSYGGMLSAWLRMKYPNLVSGAIAASAPIWGFPRTSPDSIDGAYRFIKHGLEMPFPPTKKQKPGEENHCATNLVATWPLLKVLGNLADYGVESNSYEGNSYLTSAFRLCQPLSDVDKLIEWGQSPWFDLAEGSYPYPSSYIPFALIKNKDRILELPAWPVQAACWDNSHLFQDWGVKIDGDLSEVDYNVTYGDSGLTLAVNWDEVTVLSGFSWSNVSQSKDMLGLLTSVRDAVAIWYNITHDEECFDLEPAPNMELREGSGSETNLRMNKRETWKTASGLAENSTVACQERIAQGSWDALCCNEEMNLVVVEATGMGNDIFWPPSYPRWVKNQGDVVDFENNTVYDFCSDPFGYFGYPTKPPDPWATRYDTYYGGLRIESHSNIVFSNGLLDPWTSGGVVARSHGTGVDAAIQHIGKKENDLISLTIEFGGHHTDLMYSSDADPPCVKRARETEKKYISKWIKSSYLSHEEQTAGQKEIRSQTV